MEFNQNSSIIVWKNCDSDSALCSNLLSIIDKAEKLLFVDLVGIIVGKLLCKFIPIRYEIRNVYMLSILAIETNTKGILICRNIVRLIYRVKRKISMFHHIHFLYPTFRKCSISYVLYYDDLQKACYLFKRLQDIY